MPRRWTISSRMYELADEMRIIKRAEDKGLGDMSDVLIQTRLWDEHEHRNTTTK